MIYKRIITIEEIEAFRKGAASKNETEITQEHLDTLYDPLCVILNYIHNDLLFGRADGEFNISMSEADTEVYKTVLKHLMIKQVNQYSIFEYFDYNISEQTDGANMDLTAYEPKSVIEMLGTTAKFLMESTDFYYYTQDPENSSLTPSNPDIYVKLVDMLTSNMKYDGGIEYNPNLSEEEARELNSVLAYLINNLGKMNATFVDTDGSVTPITDLSITKYGTPVDDGTSGGSGDSGGHRTDQEINDLIDAKLVDLLNNTTRRTT